MSTTMSESLADENRPVRTLFDFVEISKWALWKKHDIFAVAIYARPSGKNTDDGVG